MGNAKEKRLRHEERKNPIQKIISLMNMYWYIDLIDYATKEEKADAKERLAKEINFHLKKCSADVQGSIKASLKNKSIWEQTRDNFA